MRDRLKIIFLVLCSAIIFSGCKSTIDSAQTSKPTNSHQASSSSQLEVIAKSKDLINDAELLDKLTATIQRYEFTGSGKQFNKINDADKSFILRHAILSIIVDDVDFKLYNKSDMSYYIPVNQVTEFIEINFNLYNFYEYSPDFQIVDNFYVVPDIGFGYVVEHKIREAKYLSDNTIEVIVDGYYPEETTPTLLAKKYIFTKITVDREYEFYKDKYPIGTEIFQIKSVEEYPEGKIAQDAILFDNPKEVMVYTISNSYEDFKLKPVIYKDEGGFNYYEIIQLITSKYTANNIYMTVNTQFSPAFITVNNNNEYTDTAYKTALAFAETLLNNISGMDKVMIQMSDGVSLDKNADYAKYFADGYYKKGSAPLISVSQKEFVDIAQTIPFKLSPNRDYLSEDLYFNNANDQTAKDITNYLSDIYGIYSSTAVFETPKDIPNALILAAGINNAQMLYWGQYSNIGEEGAVFSQLEPFTQSCGDSQGVLETHAKQAAKQLLGDDVEFDPHADISSKWKYDDYAKIYTPPHMSVSYKLPIVLEYKDNGDSYDATVVFANMGYNIFIDGEILEQKNVWEYAKTKGKKQIINIKKADNKLLLYSAKVV